MSNSIKIISKKDIGIRALDIETGLHKYNDTLIDLKLRDTILIGKCASLASHLRGVQVIENFEALTVLSSKLGISSELYTVLEILDEIRYIRIIGTKRKPSKIEVLLDKFETTYERLGDIWLQHEPQEFEQKTISLINELSSNSKSEIEIYNNYDLEKEELDTLYTIGKQGGFLDSYNVGNEERYFSPIYMEENASKVMETISRYNDDAVKKTLKLLEVSPGLPIINLKSINNDLILEIMEKNIIQTPAIKASGGKVDFLFSPFTQAEDKQMLKHARNVVAAVRYGEKFSTISTLHRPIRFLEALLERNYIGKTPHTDIEAQYGVLRDSGLGRIEEIFPGRYRFYLADTEYARSVVKLAQSILFKKSDFDPDLTRGIIDEAWEMRERLSSYQFNEYIPNLSNLKNINYELKQKQNLNKSTKDAKTINKVLNKLFVSGGEPDVF